MRLEGRKALVTGGASGIGAAISRRLAAEGAEVWIGDINDEGAERGRRRDRAGTRWSSTSPTSTRPGRASRATGTLDILVNNAGTDEFGFFTQTTPEQWDAVIAVNLDGVLNCTARGAAGDAGGRLRADRQHRLGGGPGRLQGLGRLLGREGRRDRLHEGDRARERPLRDHRQLDRARARSRRRC